MLSVECLCDKCEDGISAKYYDKKKTRALLVIEYAFY